MELPTLHRRNGWKDIVPSRNTGSYYYNYKGKHSMVLLAIVDANYRFLLVDFGTNGRVSDGGVLQNTRFYEKLEETSLRIPEPDNVTEKFNNVPYVFVADDAFPLSNEILKPYRQASLDSAKKEVFNYRLSRARHVVENAFGILASRFRIFHTAINLEPKNIEKVVMATCALHNFLMNHEPTIYAPANCLYQENDQNGSILSLGYDSAQSNMNPLESCNRGNICGNAKQLREKFVDYFIDEGKVQWQNKHILRNKQK
uniref:DDE Tnp4 domain-containing protein n=1 Tax=Cacopsylla melanoneura TaxID=428564 RepID=A0A8D8TCT4_9HEMI